VTVYTWIGIVMIPGNVLIAPMLVGGFWQARGWRSGLTVAAVILIVDAVVFGGFWVLQAAQKRFPALTRIRDADAAFDRENPDIVVVLRRRVDTPRGSIPTFGQIRLP
jgi:MFS family permease